MGVFALAGGRAQRGQDLQRFRGGAGIGTRCSLGQRYSAGGQGFRFLRPAENADQVGQLDGAPCQLAPGLQRLRLGDGLAQRLLGVAVVALGLLDAGQGQEIPHHRDVLRALVRGLLGRHLLSETGDDQGDQSQGLHDVPSAMDRRASIHPRGTASHAPE